MDLLRTVTDELKQDVRGQYLAKRVEFEKSKRPSIDLATLNAEVLTELDRIWDDLPRRLAIVPAKQTLSSLNRYLQENLQITISTGFIVSCFLKAEIPGEMLQLIDHLERFAKGKNDLSA